MAVHPNSLRALREHGPKKGDPSPNKLGINGWTKLREKTLAAIEADADDMLDVLIKLAKEGDVQALKLALGPILNVTKLELGGTDDRPVSFSWAKPQEAGADDDSAG